MLISFIRTLVLYIIVVAAMRIMGKRQVGELQPSELVITIMISELASIPVQETGIPLTSGIIPILTLVVAEVFLSYAAMRNKRLRKLILGTPSVIICNGKIVKSEMEKLRINSDDLSEELRQLNCTNIHEVAFGIIETNGKLSLVLKPDSQPYTVADAKKLKDKEKK